jgi:hypothetical protein
MVKYASWFVAVLAFSVAGCKTLSHTTESNVAPTGIPDTAKLVAPPTPSIPEQERPVYVGISKKISPPTDFIPEAAPMPLAPVEVEAAPTDDFKESLREFSAAVADWSSAAKTAVSTLKPLKSEEPAKVDETSWAFEPVPTPAPSTNWLEKFWYWTAPMWTAICAYIVAPLIVDILKQHMGSNRKHRRKSRRVQAA